MEDFGNIPAGAGQGPPGMGGTPPGMDQQGGGQVPPEFEILQAIMEGGQVDDGNGNTLDFSIIPEEVRVGIQEVVMGSDPGQQGPPQQEQGPMPGGGSPIMPGMGGGSPPGMMGGQGGGMPPNIPPEIIQMLLSQQGGMR